MNDINGYVRDAGGGVVEIIVDRDTESYPHTGERVTITRLGDNPVTDDYPTPITLGAPDPQLAEKLQQLDRSLRFLGLTTAADMVATARHKIGRLTEHNEELARRNLELLKYAPDDDTELDDDEIIDRIRRLVTGEP